MRSKKVSRSGAGPTGTVRSMFDAKRYQRDRNRSDFFDRLLSASHTVRMIWSDCHENIEKAFRKDPYRTRKAIVFDSVEWDRGIDGTDVRCAAALLRHRAMGWSVRVSTRKIGGKSAHIITYFHRGIVDD